MPNTVNKKQYTILTIRPTCCKINKINRGNQA